jgi:hypothetical protein
LIYHFIKGQLLWESNQSSASHGKWNRAAKWAQFAMPAMGFHQPRKASLFPRFGADAAQSSS